MALVSIIFITLFLFVLAFCYILFFKSSSKLMVFAVLFIMVFLLLIGFTYYDSLIELEKVNDYSKLGPFGDYIGGVLNPLISVFAVFAAGFAFYAQYQANKQVQDQFIKQEKKDYIQNFENKLFKLIEFQNQIVQDIDMNIWIFNDKIINEIISNNPLPDPKYSLFHETHFEEENNLQFKELEIKSRDSFKFSFELLDNILSISNELSKKLNSPLIKNENELNDDENELYKEHFEIFEKNFTVKNISYNEVNISDYFNSIYSSVFSKINIDLGHYYRNLYRIFKIIDEATFDENKNNDFKLKYQYASIVRSQLSDYEIYFLFYNGISEYGISKFKKLIEKYSLLKIIPVNNKSFEFHFYKKLYDKNAFGKI
jgi:hypothetical protein